MLSNGFTAGAVAALLGGAQLAAAHMEISYPAPFRSKFNPNAVNVDYTNTAPLAADGSNYPCKGYQSDLGSTAGASTATFAPGGSYNFTVTGGAAHGGGSCQVSLSYDKGATFTVIQSIIGGCPLASNYPFSIPADAPTGDAIWAWTWQNNIGNREQYMNCAAVTIGGGSAKREIIPQREVAQQKRAVSFTARPQVFIANIGNGCSTSEGSDVQYPNPGPDVVNNGGKLGQPIGSCAAAVGGGSGSDTGSAAPASSTAAAASPSVTTAAGGLPGGVFITVPVASASSTAVPVVVAPTATTLVVSTVASASKVPVATGGAGAGTGSGSGAGAGGYTVGTACTNEGAYNCISGKAFQRCASGTWSAVINMAAGTKCDAGEAATLVQSFARRSAGPRWRRAAAAQLE